jgi:hypothetical protein
MLPQLVPLLAALALCPFWHGMRARDTSLHISRAPARELARGLCWSPTSWRTWYHFGRALALDSTPAMRFGEKCMSKAAEYDPNNYVLWNTLCSVRLQMGDREGARAAFARARQLRSWLSPPKGLQDNR